MKLKVLTLALVLLTLFSVTGCSRPPQQRTIQGLDIKFNPDRLDVKAGQPIELRYENHGLIDHTFKIDGIVDEVKIRPGSSYLFTFTVQEPGDYQFVCALPGRAMAGMVGTLHVE